MRIIDTHMHLIYLDRFRYPWLAGEPTFNRPHHLGKYLGEARSAGIEDIVFMETTVADDEMAAEAEFVCNLDPSIRGAIAGCLPERSDFAEYLERIARNSKVRGLRRILHIMPDEFCLEPRFVENVRRLAPVGRLFELCVLARQLPAAGKLAISCPDVQFVLDHCGIPDLAGDDLSQWRTEIAAIATLPNVACKISGIIAYGGPARWSAEGLAPVIEHVIDCFGWQRIVWGSDWPICNRTASLTEWVEVSRTIVAGCSIGEQAALFHGNAERIYGVTPSNAAPTPTAH